jgi:hydrogenase expression/formation protein HypC
MKVLAIEGEWAVVEVGGVRKEANVQFIEDLRVGEYVIVHAGFAIQKVDPAQAEETIGLYGAYGLPTED